MKTEFINCAQCDSEFEFTPSEQEQYFRKGFDPPKRCPDCRRKKSKLEQNPFRQAHAGKRKQLYHDDDD